METSDKEEKKVLSEEDIYFSDVANRVYPLYKKYAEYADSLKAKQALSRLLLEKEKLKKELVDSIERLEMEVVEEQDKYTSV